MRLALVFVSLLSCGCSRYSDFTLPVLPSPAEGMKAEWSALPSPVLTRGAAGEWDDVDALNPSVIKTGSHYLNIYSGFDGAVWHTGVATSNDGLSWMKAGKVISPDSATWEGSYIAANGSALAVSGTFYYWYQAGGRTPKIGLATSSDARRWSKLPEPVLDTGPRGSWDERGVADPYVIRIGQTYFMYYLGQDRARRQRLGLAQSHDGRSWEKLRSNPVLEIGEPGTFDELGLGEPAVWSQYGTYWMLYTGRDRKEHRKLGLARSQDGVKWTRVPGAVFGGTEAWNGKVICDPSVEETGDGVRVWFGGGDRASPDENLNGSIGFATLKLTPVTLAK